MIAWLAVLYGINSTRNGTNSTRLRLVLLRASLVLLIPNSTANRAITYTNRTLPVLEFYTIKEYKGIGNASRELGSNNTIALKQAC